MRSAPISRPANTGAVAQSPQRLVPEATAVLLASPPQPVPCPAAATVQLDGFYRWFLATRDGGRLEFQSQKQRFTPELYRELRAAFALQLADGRFVDFDSFSNSQVGSYRHRIAGCRRAGDELRRVAGFSHPGAVIANPVLPDGA